MVATSFTFTMTVYPGVRATVSLFRLKGADAVSIDNSRGAVLLFLVALVGFTGMTGHNSLHFLQDAPRNMP